MFYVTLANLIYIPIGPTRSEQIVSHREMGLSCEDESSRSVMVNVLDCNILVNKFEPQLHCHTHFRINNPRKGMNPLIPQTLG